MFPNNISNFGTAALASPRRERAVRIYIEMDDLDASLALPMAIAGMPDPIAKLDVADLGEIEAFPLTARPQRLAAPAGELVGQRDLLPIGVAEDDGTQFPRVPVISAEDLLALPDRLFEQRVGATGHRASRSLSSDE